MLPLFAAAATAVAAWLSQGTLAYESAAAASRVAVLPISIAAAALSAAAFAIVLHHGRRGRPLTPLVLLSLVFVSWLPVDLPPALLVWSGRSSLLVWIALAACLAPGYVPRLGGLRRPQVLAAALALLIGGLSYWQASPQVPGGDEPHYLVITQSLLNDGDLKIENNHARREYEAYFAGDLRKPDFIARGRDGEIYSIHAPGVSALVAPVFALAGYGGVVALLLVLSALGSALAWHLAWLVTAREDAAWFGWAAVTFSATWIFHSFSVYPDGPGAVLVLVGVWALVRAAQERTTGAVSIVPWLWHGAGLAALPWMHTRFSVLAGGLGALVLLRLAAVPNPAAKAFAFLAVPALSFLGWLSYFISIYGTANPAAPYGLDRSSSGFQFVPDGLGGLLFDQGFGLLAYAPVLLFGFVGIGVMAARTTWRRHALEQLFVLVPYLVVVTHYAMWWGGRSAPARFFVAVLPWMAIPAAACWVAMGRRASRTSAVAALLFTLFASAVLVVAHDGSLAFNERQSPAAWLDWLNGSLDLARALPMWMRERELPLFRGIVVWLSAALLGWLILRSLDRHAALARRETFGAAAAMLFAVAGMVAATASWWLQGVPGLAPTSGQLEVLRRLSTERRVVAVRIAPPAILARNSAASSLRIEPAPATGNGGAGPNDRPLYSVPAVPAGDYRLRLALRGFDGWAMLGIGRDQFAMRTDRITSAQTLDVSLPVDVRALILRVDEDARQNIRGLILEPLRVATPDERLSDDFARHAVRYGGATVYFLDDRSFPEPEAFWVGGSRASDVVIRPDESRATATLIARNGAAENTVMISSGGWREELRLGPGEERRLHVPLDHARGATLLRISASSGFRPSAVDPKSRDHRFLGIWIKLE